MSKRERGCARELGMRVRAGCGRRHVRARVLGWVAVLRSHIKREETPAGLQLSVYDE